jgi:adenosine deaminase
MTLEYLCGALDQQLDYRQLKKMARASLEYAFIPGTSSWSAGRNFTPVKECAADLRHPRSPSPGCQNFLNKNEKANLQWTLELQLTGFESQIWPSSSTSPKPITHR